MRRIHLRQELNTADDSFSYSLLGATTPLYLVDSSARLFKSGVEVGYFKLRNEQWHLYIGDKLYMSGPENSLYGLPEFELKALTALVNEAPDSPEQALKDIAAQLVPAGARAGSVYQELLSLGYLVPIEDCKAEVERVLTEIK